MLAILTGLPEHSLPCRLSAADTMPVLAACCLSAGVGGSVRAACHAARLAAVSASRTAWARSAETVALCLLLLAASRALIQALAFSEGS